MHFDLGPLTILLCQIAAIIIVSRTLGIVFKWLGQPLVMAEVVGGILLGPSLFGLVWPEGMQALFPASSLGILKMLSQVGLLLFMFLVGLELDPKLLRGRQRAAVMISHTSIVFPFLLGVGASWWLYKTYSTPGVKFTSFMLFSGIAMSVTAFPVLARILSERNMLTSRIGAIAIACAAVDDVTAWCMLAVVVGVARSRALIETLYITGFTVAYILVMIFAIRPFLRRIGGRLVDRSGLSSNMLAILMCMLVASSAITEIIGIHALFGAFLFGAILPKDGPLTEILAEKLESVSVILLLPLFFAFSGLRTEIGLVSGASDILATLVIIGLASLGKFGGSTIAARLTGIGWRESAAIGTLMNTRGLMELVVLNIGLDLGVISTTLFTMLVIMALVTTFATTPVFRWLHPESEESRMHLAPPLKLETRIPQPFTLLMCVADPRSGEGMALVASSLLGARDPTAHAYALHLTAPTDRPSVARRKRETNEQAPPLVNTTTRARELGVDLQTLEFVSSDPGTDITRTADAKQASLLLLGWHKPLLLEGPMGGTVKKVVTRSRRPVAVLIDRQLHLLKRVLVAIGSSPADAAALRVALQLAGSPSIELTVVQVAVSDNKSPLRDELTELWTALEARPNTRMRFIQDPWPADLVIEISRRDHDLLVFGIDARDEKDTVFADQRLKVIGDTTISVLAVHPGNPDAASASSDGAAPT
jgi:Kef-type K+ transport system membrane component KefB/nucleotide-binding universal stress UspA family protein